MSGINEELLNKVANLLKEKRIKIATAESCTGGMLANLLTNISGSSEYFDRGIVSYSNRAKMEMLGVSKETLDKYGAVSEETAREMAEGIRRLAKVDMGISTTGIAGPTGGTEDKPVGLVYIGLSTKKGTIVKRFIFKKDRIGNKESACEAALSMLLEALES